MEISNTIEKVATTIDITDDFTTEQIETSNVIKMSDEEIISLANRSSDEPERYNG